MSIHKHKMIQGSPQWHDVRKGKITGTSALDLLKYGKKYAIEKNTENNFKGNYSTERGSVLEHEAIELYEAINNVEVERPGFITNTDIPDCGCSPDGINKDVLVEVKCLNETNHLKNIESPDVNYLVQCQWNMWICGLNKADLLLYNPEADAKIALYIHRLELNPKTVKRFKEKLA